MPPQAGKRSQTRMWNRESERGSGQRQMTISANGGFRKSEVHSFPAEEIRPRKEGAEAELIDAGV